MQADGVATAPLPLSKTGGRGRQGSPGSQHSAGAFRLTLFRAVLHCSAIRREAVAVWFMVARFAVLAIAGLLLASCGGVVTDAIPHWAGGLPKNAPPRPGSAEYEVYKQQLAGEAARDKSKDAKDEDAKDAGVAQR